MPRLRETQPIRKGSFRSDDVTVRRTVRRPASTGERRPVREPSSTSPSRLRPTSRLPRDVEPAAENIRPLRRPVPLAPAATPSDLYYEIGGVTCLAAGCMLLYNALLARAEGILPRFGIGALRWMFGLGAIIIPAVLCWLGLLLIVRRHRAHLPVILRRTTAAVLVFLAWVHVVVPTGQELHRDKLLSYGGVVGALLVKALRCTVGDFGTIVSLTALTVVALLLFTEISLSDVALALRRIVPRRQPRDREPRRPREVEINEAPTGRALPREIVRAARAHRLRPAPAAPRERNGSPFLPLDDLLGEADETPPEPALRLARDEDEPRPAPERPGKQAPVLSMVPPPPTVLPGLGETSDDAEILTPTEALEAQAQATAGSGQPVKKVRPQKARRRFGNGPLLPEYFDEAVRALDPPIVADNDGVEEDVQKGIQGVQETLAAFRIDARVTDVKRGPVITRYEVQPAPGVRVAAIANLDRDLARALSALAVRIEAPVPGKNVVGIEVPNKKVHLVRLRDVLELPDFLSTSSKLSFVLGRDIAGQPKWADLTKMPHLLIAGATNSGKSVCLNSIIASILVRATPEEVKFSLIDPKRVELTLFRDVRHLYHPVVVEPKDAVRALRGAIAEMDRRYKRFAERGVRNIASYNSKLEEDEAPLPYIVIVIDELADLMMTAAAEFEKLICRLAQLARATGIHLIVATQRPSVNVITGVIKANIPARIAFAVASQVDSRTILDSVGAERLIGSGDMLFDSNNGGKPVRIQGAYLSEEEVNNIVQVVKSYYASENLPLEYGMNLEEIDEEMGEDGDSGPSDEKRDDLYDAIREFVLRQNEMSASMIQRKFEIGYPRAGRIVDQLERDGILSPADGSKPRKVIGNGRGTLG